MQCLKPLRLFNRCLVEFIKRSTDASEIVVNGISVIGSKGLLQMCERVIEDLERRDKKLVMTLAHAGVTFCLVPYAGSSWHSSYFYVGRKFIAWGEEGIRACVVSAAFRVAAGLNDTTFYVRQLYSENNILSVVDRQTAEWLRLHEQPPELIACFAK